MGLALTSTAFEQGATIPTQYTADGRDVSPPLQWSDPPAGTRSLSLICEDPDAPRGTFTHWVAFQIPRESRELSEGVPAEQALPDGTAQGANSFGKLGYRGPSPPPGKPHRYVFKLFALDRAPQLQPGATREELLTAIDGHVLGEAALTGTYGRS